MSGVFSEVQRGEGSPALHTCRGLPGGASPPPSPFLHAGQVSSNHTNKKQSPLLENPPDPCAPPTPRLPASLIESLALVVAPETWPADNQDKSPVCPDVFLPGLSVAHGNLAVLPARLPSPLLLGLK